MRTITEFILIVDEFLYKLKWINDNQSREKQESIINEEASILYSQMCSSHPILSKYTQVDVWADFIMFEFVNCNYETREYWPYDESARKYIRHTILEVRKRLSYVLRHEIEQEKQQDCNKLGYDNFNDLYKSLKDIKRVYDLVEKGHCLNIRNGVSFDILNNIQDELDIILSDILVEILFETGLPSEFGYNTNSFIKNTKYFRQGIRLPASYLVIKKADNVIEVIDTKDSNLKILEIEYKNQAKENILGNSFIDFYETQLNKLINLGKRLVMPPYPSRYSVKLSKRELGYKKCKSYFEYCNHLQQKKTLSSNEIIEKINYLRDYNQEYNRIEYSDISNNLRANLRDPYLMDVIHSNLAPEKIVEGAELFKSYQYNKERLEKDEIIELLKDVLKGDKNPYYAQLKQELLNNQFIDCDDIRDFIHNNQYNTPEEIVDEAFIASGNIVKLT